MTPAPRDRALAWAVLAHARLPGPVLVPLLRTWPDPRVLLAQGRSDLLRLAPAAVADRIARASEPSLLARVAAWLEDPAHQVVTWEDADYPQALLALADAPPALFLLGRRDLLNRPALAIVGSRSATPGGLDNARAFAAALAQAGLTIVSGLALGIDGAAHAASVDTPAGTIAVVGTGLDRVYPARHRDLAHAIAQRGALVSELAPGTPVRKEQFPRRNRLISGLARGVLVVEATLSSGSLITARHALEQGREVFAIPGSIHSPFARGCHRLIRDGAKLVETAHDVLVEFGMAPLSPAPAPRPTGRRTRGRLRTGDAAPNVTDLAPQARRGVRTSAAGDAAPLDASMPGAVAGSRDDDALLDPHAAVVLDALGHDPADADTLIARTRLPASAVSAALVSLELGGHVHALAGGRFERRS
jgi:DNA processing protein